MAESKSTKKLIVDKKVKKPPQLNLKQQEVKEVQEVEQVQQQEVQQVEETKKCTYNIKLSVFKMLKAQSTLSNKNMKQVLEELIINNVSSDAKEMAKKMK
ncbi:hypothetical protein KLM65_18360 [Clostridioides difficile]|nr:hypothetical protein [Clostridioides difficile]